MTLPQVSQQLGGQIDAAIPVLEMEAAEDIYAAGRSDLIPNPEVAGKAVEKSSDRIC